MRYKLKIEAPDEAMYKEIFRAQCAKKDLAWDEFAVEDFVASLRASGRALAACQPRDLIDQIIDHAIYRGEKPSLTTEALDRAAGTYFGRF